MSDLPIRDRPQRASFIVGMRGLAADAHPAHRAGWLPQSTTIARLIPTYQVGIVGIILPMMRPRLSILA